MADALFFTFFFAFLWFIIVFYLFSWAGFSNLSNAMSWPYVVGLWYDGWVITLLTLRSCSLPTEFTRLWAPSLKKAWNKTKKIKATDHNRGFKKKAETSQSLREKRKATLVSILVFSFLTCKHKRPSDPTMSTHESRDEYDFGISSQMHPPSYNSLNY